MIKSFIKWSGGKSSEFNMFSTYIPKNINNFYEPFVGGGSVYLSVIAKNYFINDKSDQLINFYNVLFHKTDYFLEECKNIDNITDKLSLLSLDNFLKFSEEVLVLKDKTEFVNSIKVFTDNNTKELSTILGELLSYDAHFFFDTLEKTLYKKFYNKSYEKELNLIFETCLLSSFYTYLRHLFNKKVEFKISKDLQALLYFYIRSNCFSGMFRYSTKGDFNVPYGGITYNKNRLKNRVEKIFREHNIFDKLKNTKVYNLDFEDFLRNDKSYHKDDFILLDPPYDTTFSSYDMNIFGEKEHIRLRDCLLNMKTKWMIVIKETEFIKELYCDNENIFINSYDNEYSVNIKNRNDKKVKHLIITNYKI